MRIDGVRETNPLPEGYHETFTERIERSVPWTAKGLEIVRFRLISDIGFPMWDVSYCHGVLDGEPVRVELPFFQLPKGRVAKAIVEHAKRDGVYAKGLGIFDAMSTLQ